jgi:AcrR family transcriptional regulator
MYKWLRSGQKKQRVSVRLRKRTFVPWQGKKGDEGPSRSTAKGKRTREEIVARALDIAALDGLGALSIGSLAKELKMSKSGLFVHFGSKENLEAAVVDAASDLFFSHIVLPAEEDSLEGIERVWVLCDLWLEFVEDHVLPGGYFFTGAFFQCAGQDGSIPRAITRIMRQWFKALREAVDGARSRGELRLSIDAKQTALELNGLLLGAQWSYQMEHKDGTQARLAILTKLASLATEEIPEGVFDSVRAWRKYLDRRQE